MDGYREHRPHPALRPWVECYWTLRSVHRGRRPVHRILPDGRLDILFNFGDPPPAAGSASDVASVVGTMTRPLVFEPGRREDLLGVRFRPGRARAFLAPPARELTDRTVALAALWGRPGDDLGERLAALSGPWERLRELERELLRRRPGAAAPDAVVEQVIARVRAARGAVAVRSLAAEVGLSRQRLARRFSAAVGLSPKRFCRLVRFRALLARLRRGDRLPWAAAAAELGYYDQPHLIADFREFTGLSPTRFLAAR